MELNTQNFIILGKKNWITVIYQWTDELKAAKNISINSICNTYSGTDTRK